MPRKLRRAKQRTALSLSDLASRAKWGGILPDVPELTEEQRAEWEDELVPLGINPSANRHIDVSRFYELTGALR